ncbi:MAG: homospermidine synthase [Gammaproteobacteria bacterium]|nr:homospermidine synthase [Gammaproteobacteria bacterium]
MIGFGSIGQAVLPLILRHLVISPQQILILTKDDYGIEIAQAHGVSHRISPLTQDNYLSILKDNLSPNDFLLNLSVDVSSVDLIKYCQSNDILYLDTCVEPWAGGYADPSLSPSLRSNYALRDSALALKRPHQPTAVITHGANPGLVSHFVKQALLNIAEDAHYPTEIPQNQNEWAGLAQALNIKTIHIAERDTQLANIPKKRDEFVNTWSVEGFIGEGLQPAELGWGTHEKHWPHDAHHHEFGEQNAIYLSRPGASTRVRTWTPMAGPFHGFLITHGESISISHYFTVKDNKQVIYRPTVHYAYHPCDDAVLSIDELAGMEWQKQGSLRLMNEEITQGIDELGVLLMGHERGAYWYGSQLSIEEARELVPHNNATSLQVAISVLGGMIWAMTHPHEGIVEPDEMDYQLILNIARPYLGQVCGHYTDWTPLTGRGKLFAEKIDNKDPWQFLNVRVN